MAIKNGDTYKVSTKKDPLNLRESPNGKIIGSLPKGKTVKISNANKCTSTWLYVVYNGKSGYASKQYLTASTDKKSSSASGKRVKKKDNKPKSKPKNNSNNKPTKRKATSKATMNDVVGINWDAHIRMSGLYSRAQISTNRFDKYFRYGHIDPYYNITNTREYIFFTKPDLNIQDPTLSYLNPQLEGYPFFQEMFDRYKDVLDQLQLGDKPSSQMSQLLNYHVIPSVDLPSVSAKTVEGPQTIYGIGVDYRGDGRSSDYNYDFSIQFTDDKLLTCYRYFKTWEEYERLKKKGLVSPPKKNGKEFYYQYNKILHDQIGIYKFIVGEDGREILYYAYYCGAFPKTVPRDSFNELKENPTYSIDWQCFRVIDMDPRILYNFNRISGLGETKGISVLQKPGDLTDDWLNGSSDHLARKIIDVTNQSDMEPVDFPFVYRVKDSNHISGYTYQLLWYVRDTKKTYEYINKYQESITSTDVATQILK